MALRLPEGDIFEAMRLLHVLLAHRQGDFDRSLLVHVLQQQQQHNDDDDDDDDDERCNPDICDSTGIVSYVEANNLNKPQQVVSTRPLSPDLSYFEIEIKCTGQRGAISVGLVPENYPRGNHPGWRAGSIGYHADDGGIFVESGRKSKVKDTCTQGDKMGCGIDIQNGTQFVYFTKNGQEIASQPFGRNDAVLYPCVALNSLGEQVQLLDTALWELNIHQDDTPASQTEITTSSGPCRADINPDRGHMSFFWKEGPHDEVIVAPIPISDLHSIFEIEIFALAKEDNVTIALVPRDYQHGNQRTPAAVSFQASEGLVYCGSKRLAGVERHRCNVNDRMAIGAEFVHGKPRSVYFMRNSSTFAEETLPQSCNNAELYPAVILHSSARTVSVCVQDCADWRFAAPQRTQPGLQPPVTGASSITVDVENCTARLTANKEKKEYNGTLIAAKPFSSSIGYFQIEILSGDTIAVGMTAADHPTDKLPGLAPGSIGYHSSGRLLSDGITISVNIDKSEPSDTIGCGMFEDEDGKKIYFTKNGVMLVSELPIESSNVPLYPAIGMKTTDGDALVYIADSLTFQLLTSDRAQTRSQTSSASSSSATSQFSGSQQGTPVSSPPTDVMEKLVRELQCSVCWSTLRQPKVLPCCQHTFCLECIRNYAREFRPGRPIPCPECRKTFQLPSGGVSALESSVIVNRLLELTESLQRNV